MDNIQKFHKEYRKLAKKYSLDFVPIIECKNRLLYWFLLLFKKRIIPTIKLGKLQQQGSDIDLEELKQFKRWKKHRDKTKK